MGVDIAIDRERRMGSGNCAYWAPPVVDLDDDGLAVVVGDPAGQEDRVRLAAQNRPTAAITVTRRCRTSDQRSGTGGPMGT